MSFCNQLINNIALPKFIKAKQNFDTFEIYNVGKEITDGFKQVWITERIKPGQKIGITVGSRGIANLKEIVKLTSDSIKSLGAIPYILPCMGSHGGATSDGQTRVLNKLGITEDFVGARILSSMEVVKIGITSNGLPVYVDKYSTTLDGIIVLNRVKPHTDINGDIESGLQKMIAVGLGKQKGADICHLKGLNNTGPRIKEIADFILNNYKVLFGIALIENAFDKTCGIAFVPKERIKLDEPQLLKTAKDKMAKLYVNNLDILIVDYIGKNISGTGMDPNIIGRGVIDLKNKDIKISEIVALNLTKETIPNGIGIGLADFTTKKVLDNLLFDEMYSNALTAIALNAVRIPMVLDDDKKAIQAAIKMSCKSTEEVRIARIKDTLSLYKIMVSESLLNEVEKHENITVLSEPEMLSFDNKNNLTPDWSWN
jgi:hypothetical protein